MEVEARSTATVAAEMAGNCNVFGVCQNPVVLKFEDVIYKINVKNSGADSRCRAAGKKATEHTILKGISGFVLPGEMLAMMGPSGSGKTSLLTALSGRSSTRSGHRLSGAITYNGRPFSSLVKHNTGFVSQDDVLYQHLTVRETLLYTALLRLPSSLSRAEKASVADAVVAQLGLSGCRDSIIGGPFKRGISGGERKRVCVGQEMLVNPALIFLDEPTSGLDSTTAHRTVEILRELAVGGRTVVMTIHQPSSRLFYMFNKVLLLSEGNPVYFGNGSEAMDYLAEIGFSPSAPMNPADFLLDVANGVSPDGSLACREAMKEALLDFYNEQLRETVRMKIQAIQGMRETDRGRSGRENVGKWNTTWWEQFSVLLGRGIKERKHQAFSILKILQVLAGALMAGLLWWQSGTKTRDQIGLLFFNTGFWAYFPVYEALFAFPQERQMLAKERSSGMYRLSAYFVSRTVADLPMELVLPTVYTTMVYWMAGLKPSAVNFFTYVVTILFSVLVSQGMGFAIGALIMDLKKATTLASVTMLGFMLGGGFFVQNIPFFIAWIKYLSFIYYSFKIQLFSQYLPEETYQCGTPELQITCKVADIPAVKVVGFNNKGLTAGIMVIMFFFFRIVAYLALRKVGATN